MQCVREIRIVKMAKVILMLGILATALNFVDCVYQKNREVTEPDMFRNAYLKTEKSLWEDVVNDKKKSREDRLKSIFTEHNHFVNSYLKDHLDFDDLKMLLHSFTLHPFENNVINVHRLFVTFQQHLNRESKYVDKGTFNDEVSLDLAQHVLDDQSWPLKVAMENLQDIVSKDRLYSNILSNKEDLVSEMRRSTQQILFQFYETVVIVQLEAYMMMQCSYMLRTVYEKGDYSNDASILRGDYLQESIAMSDVSSRILGDTKRDLWRSDPRTHVDNRTYIQVTRLLQGHIENEIDLNRGRSCMDTCQNYQFLETGSFGCSDRSVCNRQLKCNGKILSCTTLEDNMWICPSKKESMRRYEYIVYDSGKVLGEDKPCSSGFHLENYWFYNVLWHCDHCFCICDEQSKKSDRFFSLKPTVSDTKNNMVVVGTRFIKINRIIHLQIKEARLLKYGKVDEASARWVPVSTFSILDKGVREGVDYHTLLFERRQVDLDDLTAPVNHVVTGVKFRQLGSHLNLEIRASEIKFSSGTVDAEKGFWISNDNTEVSIGNARRKEVSMSWPHIPIKTKQPSLPASNSNTFIKFTHSDIGKDAAQTTVPFLDAQDVVTDPPMPLQGIGLFYKTRSGYGGFIAPLIETLDYTGFVKANLQNFRTANDL